MSGPSSDAQCRVIDEEDEMMLNHYEAVRAEADYRRDRITDQFRRANWRRTRSVEPTAAKRAPRRALSEVRPAA